LNIAFSLFGRRKNRAEQCEGLSFVPVRHQLLAGSATCLDFAGIAVRSEIARRHEVHA
jgi:hypothetical protein